MTSNLYSSHRAQQPQPGGWRTARAALAGLSMMAACAAWAAPTVIFTVTDLADTTAGEDLWRYDYTVSGPVDAFGSLNLLFSPALYASLQSQTLDPNLSLLDVQPDALAPADGIVYITPINALLAAETTALSVDVVWLGGMGSTPGSQAFEVVDGAGSLVGRGVSRPLNGGTVPEPSALLLAATALLALTAKRKRGASA